MRDGGRLIIVDGTEDGDDGDDGDGELIDDDDDDDDCRLPAMKIITIKMFSFCETRGGEGGGGVLAANDARLLFFEKFQ